MLFNRWKHQNTIPGVMNKRMQDDAQNAVKYSSSFRWFLAIQIIAASTNGIAERNMAKGSCQVSIGRMDRKAMLINTKKDSRFQCTLGLLRISLNRNISNITIGHKNQVATTIRNARSCSTAIPENGSQFGISEPVELPQWLCSQPNKIK